MKMNRAIFNSIASKKGQIAVLIDPDKTNEESDILNLIEKAEIAEVDYFFVGGSTVSRKDFESTLNYLKANTQIPVLIFPGASHQISNNADGLLYLSLISGRNPDYLIGHHVRSANEVFDMDVEIISTAYMLIEGGTKSSVAYVSQTTPIPNDNESIILNTAKAGIMQGNQVIFCDAGSGAKTNIHPNTIKKLAKLNTPIIIGGGIDTIDKVEDCKNAGANVIVIGNKIESDINFLLDIKNLSFHKK